MEIEELNVRYPGADRNALDRFSLKIARGSFFGLLGPNGAGKTTLISFICGQIQGAFAKARILGFDQDRKGEYRRRLGYAPQEIALYPSLSVYENLRFFSRLCGAGTRDIEQILEWIGLREVARKRTGTLSGGMKRRLNLGVALLNHPDLLVLDEPTVGIDPESRQFILEQINALRKNGLTLIYSTHYFEEIRKLCDEVAILNEGRLIACGPRLEVLGREEQRFFELTRESASQ